MNAELKDVLEKYRKQIDVFESKSTEELKGHEAALSLAYNLTLDFIDFTLDLDACLEMNRCLHRLKLFILRANGIESSEETDMERTVAKQGIQSIANVLQEMEKNPSLPMLEYMHKGMMDALTHLTHLERSEAVVRLLHSTKRLISEHFPAEDCSR